MAFISRITNVIYDEYSEIIINLYCACVKQQWMVYLNTIYTGLVSALVYVPLIWPLKLVSIYQVSASSTDKVGFQMASDCVLHYEQNYELYQEISMMYSACTLPPVQQIHVLLFGYYQSVLPFVLPFQQRWITLDQFQVGQLHSWKQYICKFKKDINLYFLCQKGVTSNQ